MKHISLEALGFNQQLKEYRTTNSLDTFLIGRVALEHRERYVVFTEKGEMEAELLGNLRFTAESRRDFPAVGDWVALSEYDTNKGLIHAVYPRTSLLERQSVGKTGEKQIIATNIDVGLIVQSLNRDFSLNRIERYLTICYNSNIRPIVILSKVDLVDPAFVEECIQQIRGRISGVLVIALSNATGEGLEDLREELKPARTYCMLGSSGVGKSTLINSLAGEDLMQTGAISESIDRGKHVTTHRELLVLDSGAILIDNPGMREVGIADSSDGLELTFEQIYELTNQCKFNDCSHVSEKGCAVLEALETGELTQESYENFMKLEREQEHFSSTVHERRKKDKAFGKMIKRTLKEKKRYKY